MIKLSGIISILFFFIQTSFGQGWGSSPIGIGVKPDFEIDASQTIHVSFIEDEGSTVGNVTYTIIRNDSVISEMVQVGSFLGPVDLELTSSNAPVIVYNNVATNVADLEIARLDQSMWSIENVVNDGFDGFEPSVVMNGDVPLISSINPTDEVLEFISGATGSITTETIVQDQGIVVNYGGTDIVALGNSTYGVCYHSITDSTLHYASNTTGSWVVEDIQKYGSNGSLALDGSGNVTISYYTYDVDSGGTIGTQGAIHYGIKGDSLWTSEVISSATDVVFGNGMAAQEMIDLEYDSQGSPHISYVTTKSINYAVRNTNTWAIQEITNLNNSADVYGQQITMVLDSADSPHIGTFVRGADNSESVLYFRRTNNDMVQELGLSCPQDTMLMCGLSIDTTITGIATAMEGATVTFMDSIVQDCPQDLMIMRYWIASNDTQSDTCVQIITQEVDDLSATALISDTLMIDGICVDDVSDMTSDSLSLSCGAIIDSIIYNVDSVKCDYTQLSKTWYVSHDCIDTLSTTLTQIILVTDVPIINITDTTIVNTSDSSGSIAISYTSCDMDNVSFLWSDGSSADSITGVNAGTYGLTVSNQMGCMDSFTFVIDLVVDTTMMMDSTTFICPADINIACEFLITPDITGEPTHSGYDTVFFVDNQIQDCPMDIILERSWIAQIDSTVSDTCIQMITSTFDSLDMFAIEDTLSFNNICFDDLASLIREALEIPCNITLDSISFSLDSTSCEYIELSADWSFDIGCSDSVFTGSQIIIIEDPLVAELSEPTITHDTASALSALDLDLICPADSISFSWSNGAETLDIDSLMAGDYTLTVSNTLGCFDSFIYNVPLVTIDSINLVLSCPSDTTVSCDTSIDPISTGMASAMDHDTLYFIDSIVDACPEDLIITRSWIASNNTMSDTCIQTITVERASFSDIGALDTLSFSGLCTNELELALDSITVDLPCGFVVTAVRNSADTIIGNIEYISRGYTISDTCRDSIDLLLQTIEIIDIQSFKIDNINITSDAGDSSGMVSYDIVCAPDSISFLWSDGSMDTILRNVPGGNYSLTITDISGMTIDSLNFEVMSSVIDVTITCPGDTTISCDSALDPSITGMATATGSDTLFFVDTMVDSCPADLIITRQWIASNDSVSDTCTQTITVLRNAFETISVMDTIVFDNICIEEFDGLLASTAPSLGCGITIDTTIVALDTMRVDFANYNRSWTISDACTDTTMTVSQVIMITNLQSLKIENITITPDAGDTSGMIIYDLTCAPDSISFLWSDGSMDTTLMNVPGGTYSLTISDVSGMTIDSFSFEVMSTVVDVTITCPGDTTISCDSALDPSITGMATATGSDTLFFVDTMVDSCPADLIITRQWIASNDSVSDTCTQTITVLRNAFETISVMDTIVFDNICIEEFDGLLASTAPSLGCGITIDTTIVALDTMRVDFANYNRSWTISDACTDTTMTVSQVIMITNLQSLKIENITITPDAGDTSGMIIYDITCAPDSIEFLWSDGSSDTLRTNIIAGEYGLTISDTSGVIDSFTFVVPLELPIMIDCPMDTIVSCDSSIDPAITGMATAEGADTIFFVDITIDSCPGDLIIMRQWIATNVSGSDTCTQNINVLRDAFQRFSYADTISFDNICAVELDGLLSSSIPVLSCGLVVDTTILTLDTNGVAFANYTRTWTLRDECLDSSMTFNQTVLVTDIQTFKIDNISITADNGDTTGVINYDIVCAPDSLSFLWSDGSTDTTRINIVGGSYILTVSDTAGVLDSFSFDVPLDLMTSLSCPPDTLVSCDSSLDPFNTGEPIYTGYDSVVFVDIVIDSCPGDLIIMRQWIASNRASIDTCTQQITVQRNGLSLVDINRRERLSGICIEDLLDVAAFELACGIVIDTIILNIDSTTCGFADLTRTIDLTDECIDSTISITQNITITDLPVAKIVDQTIIGDVGDSLGMIDLDLQSCSDSVSLLWSTGADTEDIDSLAEGLYSLTISDNMGCVDSLQFIVPFVDTTAFFVNIQDRNGDFLDVDSIKTFRSSGGSIISDITRLNQGQYQFTSDQTIIAGDRICMFLDQDAAVDLSVLDLIKGQRHILGLAPACADDLIAGDVNFSGSITGSDLASMQRVILALSSSFPDGLSWTFVTDGFTAASIRKEGCVEIEQADLLNRSIDVKGIKLGNFECEE